jgi:hypothetical protein
VAVKGTAADNDPNLSPQPPFKLGERARCPGGKGTVSAFAQLPGEWRLRIELDKGGHWTGSSLVISRGSKSRPGSGRSGKCRQPKSGAKA